jgi:DNA polymerase-3 subunit epsilon
MSLSPGQLRVIAPGADEEAAHQAKCTAHQLRWQEDEGRDAQA